MAKKYRCTVWCDGIEKARGLIESDWKYWGDLIIDIKNAKIDIKDNTAWIALCGTVTNFFDSDSVYKNCLADIHTILEEKLPPKLKLHYILSKTGDLLCNAEQGGAKEYPIRITVVMMKSDEKWLFKQIHFSFINVLV